MLTDRQQELMDFLRSEHRRSGIIPSTREIQEYFGFSSQTAAVSHLRALERKGVIQRDPGKARSLRFTDGLAREEILDIPIYGSIAAGMAEDQEQTNEGCVSVDVRTLGVRRTAKTFALRVRGESMVDAHILDGDLVVLQNKRPKHKDVVAALIDGETTLKRFLIRRAKPFLRAENAKFPDLIPARELIVQGVMVGLIRQN